MHRRSADEFDDPRRQVGEILGSAPVAGCGSHILPRKLRETFPFVVDEVLHLDARPGFKDHHLDAFLSQFVTQSAAAGAGTDNYDNAIIVQIKFGHDILPTEFCSKPSDFRQPIDVVEATVDVAAMLCGGTFVAELWPQLFLVVERDNQIRAKLLEEIGMLDTL